MAASSRVKTFGKLWIKPYEEEELIFEGDEDSDFDESACGAVAYNASPMEVNTDSEPDYGYGVHVMELLADLGVDKGPTVAADTKENDVAFMKAQLQAQSPAPMASSHNSEEVEQSPVNTAAFPEVQNNSMCAVSNNDRLPPLVEVENEDNHSPSSYCSSSSSSDDDSENNSIQTVLEQPIAGTFKSMATPEEEKQQEEQDSGIVPMEIDVEMTVNEPEGGDEAETMIADPVGDHPGEPHPACSAKEEHGIDTDPEEIDPLTYLKREEAERKMLVIRAVRDGSYKKARSLLDELVQTSDERGSLLRDLKFNLKLAHRGESIEAYWAKRNARKGRKRNAEQPIRKSGRIKYVKNGTYASI